MKKQQYYIKWTPKWIAGDKIKICQHQTGIHNEKLISGAFCNDCGCLVGYTSEKDITPNYVFDRRKEPVFLELNKDEVNQILKMLGRKILI